MRGSGSTVHHGRRGSVVLGLAGVLVLASGGLLAAYYLTGSTSDAQADASVTMSWSDLGAGDATFDRAAALVALEALAADHNRSARGARLDLEARTVRPEVAGFAIDVHASLTELELAARSGASEVTLTGVALPAERTVEDLGIDDISNVMGHFTTKFPISDRARNFNLKLAASKLNGHVLQPGDAFSFNDIVGPRTEKEGYKIAHVISSGEMVDGLAGGTCQISTTLHGAAFFAGMAIKEATPHSRPSTYVRPGLDATVSYPQLDLELSNPYDFPVVIHYRVARGESVVEILGKGRPYEQIEFTRAVTSELEFETVTREDDSMPVGSMVIDQHGFKGYKVIRKRNYYQEGEVVKTDKWHIRYRPVTEYVRIGTNPDPNLPVPSQGKKTNLKTPHGAGTMVQ
jgi:vancomycin resistance protein YoaR